MSNETLTKRAKELEDLLHAKLKCYVVVGWLRESDLGEVFMVYVDKRAWVTQGMIPDLWYGLPVAAQGTLPPGVKEEADLFDDIPPPLIWISNKKKSP